MQALYWYIFLELHSARTLTPMWTERADLKIHEVTISVSLSAGTSRTTESIAPLNPEINLKKYEHTYQVEDLNLGE